MPFYETETMAQMPGGPIAVRAYQIIVWVSVSVKGLAELDPRSPRFQAVIDTGNNHNFAIRQEQLERWSAISLDELPPTGRVYLGRQIVPLVGANVWIYPNKRGERDTFSRQPAFQLELHDGIVVYPQGVPTLARLPNLGVRALVRNG